MELRQVKGNTWVLDSWELIPLYKLDAHRCVLLDTLTDQGWLALETQENTLVYRKVSVPGDRPLVKLPPTGWFCDNRPVRREDIWNWNK